MACLALAACATSLNDVRQKYQEAPVCCASYSEFSYEALSIPDEKKFQLDEASPAFDFPTGKSYFKAFRLPPFQAPYTIDIRSYVMGDNWKSAYIFRPALMFLDEDFAVTRMEDDGGFRYLTAGLFETSGLRKMLQATISVTDENARDRYMIVLTTDGLLGETTAGSSPAVIPFIFPGVVGVLPVGSQEIHVPHSPAGKLKVTVSPAKKQSGGGRG
jgi:maltose operon protein